MDVVPRGARLLFAAAGANSLAPAVMGAVL